jgi:large subunit ribosomal protein L1
VPFGKCDFTENKLEENLRALAATIDKNRPSGTKGKLWKTLYITSTMGPSVQIDLATLLAVK